MFFVLAIVMSLPMVVMTGCSEDEYISPLVSITMNGESINSAIMVVGGTISLRADANLSADIEWDLSNENAHVSSASSQEVIVTGVVAGTVTVSVRSTIEEEYDTDEIVVTVLSAPSGVYRNDNGMIVDDAELNFNQFQSWLDELLESSWTGYNGREDDFVYRFASFFFGLGFRVQPSTSYITPRGRVHHSHTGSPPAILSNIRMDFVGTILDLVLNLDQQIGMQIVPLDLTIPVSLERYQPNEATNQLIARINIANVFPTAWNVSATTNSEFTIIFNF